ncbi:MAG: hypothetical protein LBU64_12370 [Planctomycetota bacterium]|nr:hypothetical protein [Planctomycetota bacterium]
MSDEARRNLEIEAALKQIKTMQKRQARRRGRAWRLDVSWPKLILQCLVVFSIGILVGLGGFVLLQIIFP